MLHINRVLCHSLVANEKLVYFQGFAANWISKSVEPIFLKINSRSTTVVLEVEWANHTLTQEGRIMSQCKLHLVSYSECRGTGQGAGSMQSASQGTGIVVQFHSWGTAWLSGGCFKLAVLLSWLLDYLRSQEQGGSDSPPNIISNKWQVIKFFLSEGCTLRQNFRCKTHYVIQLTWKLMFFN